MGDDSRRRPPPARPGGRASGDHPSQQLRGSWAPWRSGWRGVGRRQHADRDALNQRELERPPVQRSRLRGRDTQRALPRRRQLPEPGRRRHRLHRSPRPRQCSRLLRPVPLPRGADSAVARAARWHLLPGVAVGHRGRPHRPLRQHLLRPRERLPLRPVRVVRRSRVRDQRHRTGGGKAPAGHAGSAQGDRLHAWRRRHVCGVFLLRLLLLQPVRWPRGRALAVLRCCAPS
mmetsp:Transcript_48318/g.121997  ORF Transcript_48318/g.121997 Transcript_48318/m.121997 type:complete len:231 (-) Transcript_48318:538-1230(-)